MTETTVPKPVLLLTKLNRAACHEPSALDARRRIIAFFSEHLSGGSA